MAEKVNFHQFSHIFPAAVTRVPVQVESEINYITSSDRAFIAPTLTPALPVENSTALVLIEARAALGKSTLARNLAHETGGIYWDMSEIYVGHGTLWGRLAQTFGMEGLPTIMGELVSGDLLLVLDALDEAELRSSGNAFDAFLNDLKLLLATPRKKPAVAMFGRSESIEYISMWLGSDLTLARYEIEEFDKPAALQFIDSRLDDDASGGGIARHRQNRKVFERARDLLLNILERSVVADTENVEDIDTMISSTKWRNERARGFLGYAPVLESICGYIGGTEAGRSANFYHRLINELAETLRQPPVTSGSHWGLLRSVVEKLLAREQSKFVKQARSVLSAAPDAAWDRLYDSDEQLSKVLHRTSGSNLSVELPTGFSPDQEAAYRQLLQTTLPNHPFLGSSSSFVNVVMRDFTYAWAMTRSERQPLDIVRKAINDEAYQVSPMLGRFYLSARHSEESIPTCRAEDVGLIYESLIAEYSSETRPFLVVSRLLGEDEVTMMLGGTPTTNGSLIRVLECDNGVKFWRRLSRARVLGGIPISLGMPGRSFTLGPDVLIHASLFEVPAGHLRISCRARDEVRIVADEGYVASSEVHTEPEVDIRGSGFFGVFWEDIRFPWIQHASPAPPVEVDESVLLGDFVLLCRLMSFMLDGPRPANDIMRRRITGVIEIWSVSSSRMRQLIDYLGQCGILLRENDWYLLDVSQLRARGIRVRPLAARYLTPQVRQLLEDFSRSA